jgi:hypothetical protein
MPFADASSPGAMPGYAVLEFGDMAPDIGYIEGVTSDIYEEDDSVVRLKLLHEDLRAAALSVTGSINLMERLRAEAAREM